MKYLVDSDWLIDCLRGQKRAVGTLFGLAPEGLAVSILSVAELYEGAFGAANFQTHLAGLRRFISFFTVVRINDAIALQYAEISALLRPTGRRPSDIDLFIAATGRTLGLTLLTRNLRHFQAIPGLKLYP